MQYKQAKYPNIRQSACTSYTSSCSNVAANVRSEQKVVSKQQRIVCCRPHQSAILCHFRN